MTADEAFKKFARSKFRSRFRLSDVDKRYITSSERQSRIVDFLMEWIARQACADGAAVFAAPSVFLV